MNSYPRLKNGWLDVGAPLASNKGKVLRCPKCSSTNYTESISLEKCNDCGLQCDYWGGGGNDVYNDWQAKKYIAEQQAEREKLRQIKEDHEAQFYNDLDGWD